MVGRTFLQYRFLEKLGAGGMGEVFKAQDTRLNRFVAIKVLSGPNAANPERRRRFIQEAQAASALNHPNIITIHDIIADGDTQFMVMEFVAGKTLVDLIPKGGLRVPQALKYATQMTDALTVAHAAGVIHRDLKPANVMATESGLVKILDFGLAKLTDPDVLSKLDDATQTIGDAPLTVEGAIIGTVSYMSPEQAQGKKVDKRSDIFSLGAVLYEMVTGVRAFEGDNTVSTLSAILRDEVKPFAEVAPDVPPQIERLIARCLLKNRDDRWQSMQEVRKALAALRRESDSGQLYKPQIPAGAGRRRASMATAGIAAGMVALAAGGVGARWWIRHRGPAATAVAAPIPEVISPAVPAAAPEPPPAAPEPAADAALTDANIIDMVEAKVPTSVILSEIRSSKTNFNLSAAEVIRLSKAGVPAGVIEAMRNPKAAPASGSGSKRVASAAPAPAALTPPPPAASLSTPAPTPPVSAISPPLIPPVTHAPAEKLVVITVTDGSPIPITLATDIPTDAEQGQALRFLVSEDFRAGDVVVIPKGAAVSGAIVDAGSKRKFLGIGGSKMTFRLTQVDAAGGHPLKVRGTPARGPASRPVDTGSQKHSKDVEAVAGSEYVAYIEGDQTVSVHKQSAGQ
jgi:hypothetical protein